MRASILALTLPLLAADDARFFDRKVAPILTKRCLGCHSNELNDGGLSFEDRDTLFRKRVVVPGKPGESLLIEVIQHTGDIRMPPGPKLPAKEIAILTDWVRRGVPWGTKLRGKPVTRPAAEAGAQRR